MEYATPELQNIVKADKNARAKSGKGKRRREITVTYVNELQQGLLEKALVDIYMKKIKNGTLRIGA